MGKRLPLNKRKRNRKRKPKKERVKAVYTPRMAIRYYAALLDGLKPMQICSILGISKPTLRNWKREYGLMRFAAVEAAKRIDKGGKGQIIDYIYGRLPKKMQRVWDRIEKLGDDDDKDIYRKIKRIFDRKGGEESQKLLFLHALTENHFNPGEACKKCCIPHAWVKRWIEQDYDFSRLIDEIEYHKKKMGESSLLKLVKQGDTAATIFFNKTKNRDLGYGDELKVKHEGSVDHNHKHTIELGEELMDLLSKSAQREVSRALDTLERQKEQVLEGSDGQDILKLAGPKRKEA